MTEDRRNIYLMEFHSGWEKYTPFYDEERSVPPDNFGEHYGWGKKIKNVDKVRMIFNFERIKTEQDERRLRNYDAFRGACAPSYSPIFVKERILDCLEHLIDKDIQILPSRLYTVNGEVEGYYLVDIINKVEGVDKEYSIYCEYTGYLDKLVPKKENFMGIHEIAREEEYPYIYIIPSLREKILKVKKKPQGFGIYTAKENWEAGRNVELCPY